MNRRSCLSFTLILLLLATRAHAQRSAEPNPPTASTAKDNLFALLDRDGDGRLSRAEVKDAVAVLQRADRNRDGTLTSEEIELELASSVPAGINVRFLDPKLDPQEWLNRFEVESREVFSCRKAVVDALKLSSGNAVADIGAGTGLFEDLFSQQVGENGRVYAIDISPRLIEHLKQRVVTEGMKNVTVVHSKEDSIELKEASVDVAFVCDTYHHFEHHAEMLLSIRNALRPKGQLVLIDFERIPGKSSDFILGHVRGGKDVFRREIELSGFRFMEEVKIPGFAENYFLRFERP